MYVLYALFHVISLQKSLHQPPTPQVPSSSNTKSRSTAAPTSKPPNHSKSNTISTENEIEKLHSKLSSKHRSETAIRGISLTEEMIQQNELENFSAIEWVQKSRALEQQQKAQHLHHDDTDDDVEDKEDAKDGVNGFNPKPNGLKSQSNGLKPLSTKSIANLEGHLKGKIVDHNVSDFKAGTSTILVLKDRRILDDQQQIDNAEDELINVHLHEADKRNLKKEEADRTRRGLKYNPFDPEMQNVLLPQYEQRDHSKHSKAFTLNEDGMAVDEQLEDGKGLNVIERALKRTEYDLSDLAAKRQIESDYVVKFKKKKKKKKKRKRSETNDERYVEVTCCETTCCEMTCCEMTRFENDF